MQKQPYNRIKSITGCYLKEFEMRVSKGTYVRSTVFIYFMVVAWVVKLPSKANKIIIQKE